MRLHLGFMRAIKLTPLASAAAICLLLMSGCSSREPAPPQRYEFQRPQMGLPFRLVLYAGDGQSATNAAEAVWTRIADLNARLSDYEEESELSRLSRSSGSGRTIPLSDDLYRVLARGEEISRATEGAFDVTVGPLVQLWRRARRQRELPPPERLASARESVGWQKISLDHRRKTARLQAPDMRLDLGGIAKGYALDEAAAVLRELGFSRFLVSGGGDIYVGEPPPGESGWRIELAPLDVADAPATRFVRLRNAALTTSGDVFQHVEIGGVRYSHIVDPRTGIGLTDHSLVTVIARDAMTADALSTALSVAGSRRGMPLMKPFKGVEALIVRKPGAVIEATETPGFQRWLEPQP